MSRMIRRMFDFTDALVLGLIVAAAIGWYAGYRRGDW